MHDLLNRIAAEMKEEVVQFAVELIKTPSTSGEEKQVAELCLGKMRGLSYDRVFRDEIGNVVGIVEGTGEGMGIMFNSHLDHVDPGDIHNWEYDPYGGVIADGFIHGRAASDVKTGMAVQIYTAELLRRAGIKLRGRLIFTGVVQEEPAEMFGMKYLMDNTLTKQNIPIDLMISSEATSLNVFIGHRGRVELEVITDGRTSHGSAPWRGINAVYKMLKVVEQVQALEADLPGHDFLGKASIALTNISCSPGRLSIIPDRCTVSLDRRLVPGETLDQVLNQINLILEEQSSLDPNFKGRVQVRRAKETSYTGYSEEVEKFMPAWALAPDHPLVKRSLEALIRVGQTPSIGKWDFGTDASWVTGVRGIPTIGYSPMQEEYAHTPLDRASIDMLIKGLAGNAALVCELAGVAG